MLKFCIKLLHNSTTPTGILHKGILSTTPSLQGQPLCPRGENFTWENQTTSNIMRRRGSYINIFMYPSQRASNPNTFPWKSTTKNKMKTNQPTLIRRRMRPILKTRTTLRSVGLIGKLVSTSWRRIPMMEANTRMKSKRFHGTVK